MTVGQVLAEGCDDPYSVRLVWHSTKSLCCSRDTVQWAVYDMHTGNGQGGITSYSFLKTHDAVEYVRCMVTKINSREPTNPPWPSLGHHRYNDWQCGSIEDFANWLRKGVGL